MIRVRVKYANDLQTKLLRKLFGLKSLLWVKPVAMAAFVGFEVIGHREHSAGFSMIAFYQA
jgi:hypothetical protein